MGKERMTVRIWVASLATCALVLTVAELHAAPPALDAWAALLLLSVCAAVSTFAPIKSGVDGGSLRLISVFAIACVAVLPRGLLGPFAALAVLPDLWVRRHRPRGRLLLGMAFNASQTALAAWVASLWLHWAGGPSLRDLSGPRDLAVLLITAALFTLTQELLVGVIIALDTGTPIHRVSTFTLPALLSNTLIAVLGVAIAGLWLVRPVLLALVPPMLYIAHHLTRNAHLARLAEVDSKTGLHNFQFFERVLDQELANSRRTHRPLALLFADLDHFKRVNDTYGHAAGDAVLRDFATLMSGAVRKGDIVARFGGEEFVVLLPGTDGDEAVFLAERIRATTESHAFVLSSEQSIHCTVSVGVAGVAYQAGLPSGPAGADTMAELLSRADAALYQAKRTRNAVARSGDESPATPLPNSPAPPASAGATLPTSAPAAAITPAAVRPAAVPTTPPGPPAAAGQTETPDAAPAARPAPPRQATLLLWTVVAAGALAIGLRALAITRQPAELLLVLPYLGAAVLTELLQVQVYEPDRRHRISLSFSEVAIMASITALPLAGPLAAFTASLVHLVVTRQRRLDKALFNLANPTMAAAAASVFYGALRPAGSGFSWENLAAAAAAYMLFYLLNEGTIALMIALHTGRSPHVIVRETAWYSPTKILLGLIGAFVGGSSALLGVMGVLLFLSPLLLLRFMLSFYARKSQHTIETLQAAKTEVESAHAEKEVLLGKLIETVASIIDARDISVSGHSRRVAKYAMAIGKELGIAGEELALIHTAGLLHDLGKVGIPEAILHKPSRLTDDEYEVAKNHASLGERILSGVDQLADLARMVGEHHERYDGKGYPRGLAAEEISLGGRILVAADALETMLADRPYSKHRDFPEALAELNRCAGTHFDPLVVASVRRIASASGTAFFTDPVALPRRQPLPADHPTEDAHPDAAEAAPVSAAGIAERMLAQVFN